MATATKQADIRYRVSLKQRPGIVIYKVRSWDDSQDYEVTVFEGKVSGCTCPATKPCYHMRDIQAREDARSAAKREALPLNGNHGFSLMR